MTHGENARRQRLVLLPAPPSRPAFPVEADLLQLPALLPKQNEAFLTAGVKPGKVHFCVICVSTGMIVRVHYSLLHHTLPCERQ
jgi:hypothetical protein